MRQSRTKIKYPHIEAGLKYARDVISGKIPACKWVKAACRRQLDDLKRWSNGKGPYVYSPEKGEKVCDFLEKLQHIEGEWASRGETLTLEPWQKFIFTTVFGWLKPNGKRRFRTVYIEIPRKNGKSLISAGIGLYMLTEDNEAGAQVYSAATSRDQAKIVFHAAQNMARKDTEFRDHYGVTVFTHNMHVLKTASKFEPLSSDCWTLEGLNIHCGIIDELHAHKTREVFDVVKTAMGARSQPLLWLITTAGSNRAGICYEQRTYVTKFLDRIISDDTYFGIIYSIDDKDSWITEKSWKKANPNFGVSIYPDNFKSDANTAQQMASEQNSFKTKKLNIWVNADTAWMNMQDWDKCANPSLKLEDFETEPCWIGLDLASKIDIAAKAYVFKRGDEYFGLLKSYLPEERVKDEAHSKSAHYEGWSIDGWLTLTSGDMIDLNQIEQEVRDDMPKFEVRSIGFDPWQATQMAGTLLEEGAPMVEVRPNVQNFSDAMKTFEALVLAGKFHHDGNPVLTWMVSNVVCRRDEKENIYPKKDTKDSSNKIDGVVALLTAFNRALIDDGDPTSSIYDQRGVFTV